MGQIVLIGEVEAKSHDFIELSDFFEDFFSLRFDGQFPVSHVAEKVQRGDFIDHDMVDIRTDFGFITEHHKAISPDNNDS